MISANGLASGAADESPMSAYPSIHFCTTSGVFGFGSGFGVGGINSVGVLGGIVGFLGGITIGVGGGTVDLDGVGVLYGVGLGSAGVFGLGNCGS